MKTWISWYIDEKSSFYKIFLCFTVNELSQYNTCIAFKLCSSPSTINGVFIVPQWGYCVPFGFCFDYAIPFQDSKNMIWNPNYSRIPRVGYCTFIEYFVLWTRIQHALNVPKLNWSSILLLLFTWFAIPSLWKTFFEQNLQYPYIGGVKYFNRPLIYLFEWTRPSSMWNLHFILSSSLLTIGGLSEWQPCR